MLGWTAGVGLGELLPPPAGVSCSGLPCWGSPDRSEGNWRGTDSEGLVPPCALIVRRGTDSEGLVSPRALIVRRGTGSEGLGTSTCPHGILGPALDLGHLLEVSLEPPGLGEAGGDGKMYPCQEAEAGARPRAQAQSPPRACWRLGPSEGVTGPPAPAGASKQGTLMPRLLRLAYTPSSTQALPRATSALPAGYAPVAAPVPPPPPVGRCESTTWPHNPRA